MDLWDIAAIAFIIGMAAYMTMVLAFSWMAEDHCIVISTNSLKEMWLEVPLIAAGWALVLWRGAVHASVDTETYVTVVGLCILWPCWR